MRAQLDAVLSSQPFVDSPKLAEFLEYVVDETLAGRAGRIKGFTIAQDVYGRDDPEDVQTSTVVRVEAGRLRRYLNHYYSTEGSNDEVYIDIPKGKYVPGFQYVHPADTDTEDSGERRDPDLRHAAKLKSKRFSTRHALIVFAGLVLVSIGWFLLSSSIEPSKNLNELQEESSRLAFTPPSIAVMPFKNAMEDPQKGSRLTQGMAEDIITDLSRLTEVDVVAFPSVMALGPDADLETILKELNVSHVLRGSIRGTLDRVRITAQLYETKTKTQVWANRYDRELGDMLELGDELSIKIAQGLSDNFDAAAFKKQLQYERGNPGVYALFNQALHLVNPPADPVRLRAARKEFEKIVQLEPEFAGGYAGIAYTSAFLAFWGHSDSPQQDIDEAIEYANQAITRDVSFGIAYSALAFAHLSKREFDEALSVSGVGVAKQPNDPYSNAYHGYVLAVNGRPQEGINYLKRALFLDPLNPRTPFLNILGFVYVLADEPEKALESLVRSAERGGPVSPSNTTHRIVALVLLGRSGEAEALAQVLKGMSDSFDLQNWANWIDRSIRYQEDRDKLFDPLKKFGLL